MLASKLMALVRRGSMLENIMRFTPASILLACSLALTASSGISGTSGKPVSAALNVKAGQLVQRAQASLAAGDIPAARDNYETALLLSPQDPEIYLALGKIARLEKVPGKAIRYYNRVLDIDPDNQLALQGQGLAMMDKGAAESARQTLAKLRTLCKSSCAAAEPLAAAIANGMPKVAAAAGGAPKSAERQ